MADTEGGPPPRHAGILLHVTSLPGPFGVGDFGPDADRFLDFLAAAGQDRWQILPLSPPGAGNSPYAARSTFAGNPLLVSPARLEEAGLLEAGEAAASPQEWHDRVHWREVIAARDALLRSAHERWRKRGAGGGFEQFRREASAWLPDYALFMALRGAHGDRSWLDWPALLRRREPAELARAGVELAAEVEFHAFVQYLFAGQWQALKGGANARGIAVVGDIPIFVDLDSADTWANQRIFKLDHDGRPAAVAGVPPDYFSATGQRWGNPVYRWDVLAAEGYGWWVERLRWTLRQADIVRLDHFRGFAAAWEIPAALPATEGAWVPGPGLGLFAAFARALGPLPIIAEDLGLITPDVLALRDQAGIPGMKVLQFAFGDDARNPYLPHNLDRRAVVYTGTHDNDTTAGWLATLGDRERSNLQRYLGLHEPRVPDLVRLAYETVAETAIVPMQDVLELGPEARMNVPGQPEGNWGWRFRWDEVSPGRAAWLRDLALATGRTGAH